MRYLRIIIVLISVAISAYFIYQSWYLRSLGYQFIPKPHITDEYDYVWQAVSLKKYGLPVAWTILNGHYSDSKYQSRKGSLQGFGLAVEGKIVDLNEFKKDSRPIYAISEINWSKGLEQMFFVAPFFDHPPLGGLIYSFGLSKNITQFDQVKPIDFRKPALVMAIITAILLFLFVFQITGKPLVATLASAIYSTVPTYILSTRGAYLENIAPPFILGHLVLLSFSVKLLHQHRLKLSYTFIFLAGLLGGIGGLAKESSLGFLLGSLILILASKISFKHFWVMVLGIALPIVIYVAWGLWLQRDLFISIFLANLDRNDFGSLKFLTTMESLRFEGFPIDGWWAWGFVSAFLVAGMSKLTKNKYAYLILPLLGHFLMVVFMGGNNYPWYWLSMIPFLAGCSAIVIGDLFINPNLVTMIAFFLLPFSSSFYWGYSVIHKNSVQNLNLYRGAFIVLLATYLIRRYLLSNKYGYYLWMISFGFILYEIFKWNPRSVEYIIANWNNLPVPSLPRL